MILHEVTMKPLLTMGLQQVKYLLKFPISLRLLWGVSSLLYPLLETRLVHEIVLLGPMTCEGSGFIFPCQGQD